MRILLISNHYHPEKSAGGRRWQNFIQVFSERGHHCVVLTPPPHHPTGKIPTDRQHLQPGLIHEGKYGERIIRCRYRPYGESMTSRILDQLIFSADAVVQAARHFRKKRARPDVVIATAPELPTMVSGWLAARILRVPFVLEMRDAWPDVIDDMLDADAKPHVPGSSGADRLPKYVRAAAGITRFGINFIQHRADLVITTSRYFTEMLRSRGVAAQTVSNGAHISHIPNLDAPPIAQQELRILYAGTVGRSQDLRTAIAAVAQLQAEGHAVVFRILGDGAQREWLAEYARECGARVEFLGQVDRYEVNRQYAWADTQLVSLRDWNSFAATVPSKLYEALATGRHVSAVLAGEGADIVQQAGVGFVSPPSDATALANQWRQLTRDRSLLDVGKAGRDWVGAEHHYRVLATRFLDSLHDVQR